MVPVAVVGAAAMAVEEVMAAAVVAGAMEAAAVVVITAAVIPAMPVRATVGPAPGAGKTAATAVVPQQATILMRDVPGVAGALVVAVIPAVAAMAVAAMAVAITTAVPRVKPKALATLC